MDPDEEDFWDEDDDWDDSDWDDDDPGDDLDVAICQNCGGYFAWTEDLRAK